MKKLLLCTITILLTPTMYHNLHAVVEFKAPSKPASSTSSAQQSTSAKDISAALKQKKAELNKYQKHSTHAYEAKNEILKNQEQLLSVQQPELPSTTPSAKTTALQTEIATMKAKLAKLNPAIEAEYNTMQQLMQSIAHQERVLLQTEGRTQGILWNSPAQRELLKTKKELKQIGKKYEKEFKELNLTLDTLTEANNQLIKKQKTKIAQKNPELKMSRRAYYHVMNKLHGLKLSPSQIAALKNPVTSLFKLFEDPSPIEPTPTEIAHYKNNINTKVKTNIDSIVNILKHDQGKLKEVLSNIQRETEGILKKTARATGEAVTTVAIVGIEVLRVVGGVLFLLAR